MWPVSRILMIYWSGVLYMKHVVMTIRLYSVFKVSTYGDDASCEIMWSTLGIQNGVLECAHDMILGSGDLDCLYLYCIYSTEVMVVFLLDIFVFLWDTVHKGSYCRDSWYMAANLYSHLITHCLRNEKLTLVCVRCVPLANKPGNDKLLLSLLINNLSAKWLVAGGYGELWVCLIPYSFINVLGIKRRLSETRLGGLNRSEVFVFAANVVMLLKYIYKI